MRVFFNLSQQEEFDQLGALNFDGSLNDRQYAYLISRGGDSSLGDMIGEQTEVVVSLGGLSSGVAKIGDHGSITMSVNEGTITARKWGSTSGGSQFGTSTSPTDYEASDGSSLFATATVGGTDYTTAAIIQYNTPTSLNALVDQTYSLNTGLPTYDVSGDFSVVGDSDLSGGSWALDTAPTGVTINSSGVVTFDTTTLTEQSNTSVVVRYTNSGGNTTSGFSLTTNAVDTGNPTWTNVSFSSPTLTAELSEASTVVWATSDTGVTPTYTVAGGWSGTTYETGSFAYSGGSQDTDVTLTSTTPDGSRKVTFYAYDSSNLLSQPQSFTFTKTSVATDFYTRLSLLSSTDLTTTPSFTIDLSSFSAGDKLVVTQGNTQSASAATVNSNAMTSISGATDGSGSSGTRGSGFEYTLTSGDISASSTLAFTLPSQTNRHLVSAFVTSYTNLTVSRDTRRGATASTTVTAPSGSNAIVSTAIGETGTEGFTSWTGGVTEREEVFVGGNNIAIAIADAEDVTAGSTTVTVTPVSATAANDEDFVVVTYALGS